MVKSFPILSFSQEKKNILAPKLRFTRKIQIFKKRIFSDRTFSLNVGWEYDSNYIDQIEIFVSDFKGKNSIHHWQLLDSRERKIYQCSLWHFLHLDLTKERKRETHFRFALLETFILKEFLLRPLENFLRMFFFSALTKYTKVEKK